MARRNVKPFKVIGAYDSETTNLVDSGEIVGRVAFPVLHQLGILSCDISEVMPDNIEEVCDIALYRHTVDLYAALDAIVEHDYDYVPVIACHNLSFDMYALSPWLDSKRENIRVLAKSCRKPITFTICDDGGNARLVIWDTLVFSSQSLNRMGRDCGYAKLSGAWDYTKVRTPDTPLEPGEIAYAEHDVYTLLVWLSWWLRRNPDIDPSMLGLNVVTKTGVVRTRRKQRFENVRGNKRNQNVGRYWYYINREEAPKSDDELYTMFASTRGGLTFCASRFASVPFDLVDSDMRVYGYDAVSQHPAQMVSHMYPVKFHEAGLQVLDNVFHIVTRRSVDYVLNHLAKPFSWAFDAKYRFHNLRMKSGSVFDRFGIATLASARILVQPYELDENNEQGQLFRENADNLGYKDVVVNGKFAFGKLVSADVAELYLTELEAWILVQVYEWDSVEPVHGYVTSRFARPTDFSTISVMQFYAAKNAFKSARSEYFATGSISNRDDLVKLGVPEPFADSMRDGIATDDEVDVQYLSIKSDLNALYGIEVSNEYRRDTVLMRDGIGYEGEFGLCNKPKNPKTWYQFGQRIVGWSRIAQVLVMMLCASHVDGVINGDTDSVKFIARMDSVSDIDRELTRYNDALDVARSRVMKRVKAAYPSLYDPLDKIGHYELEFISERFCASWNKAYATQDVDSRSDERHFSFTVAGVPARAGLNGIADGMFASGKSFSEVCNLLLGYNVTLANSVIKLNGRAFPEWCDGVFDFVKDCNGVTSRVSEPRALCLYPMSKTLNDTRNGENFANLEHALSNNPNVNVEPVLVTSGGIVRMGEI